MFSNTIPVWFKFSKFSKLCGWPFTFYIKKLRCRKWPSTIGTNLGIRILLIYRNKFGRNLIFLVKICVSLCIFLILFAQFFFKIESNDRYGCHCQMMNLVSQDYIDYQYEERKIRQHPYSGVPVDDLDRACHNHR